MRMLAATTVLIAYCVMAAPVAAQGRSRAEVKAEAASAVKSGEIPRGEATVPKAEPKPTVTAEEKAAARTKRKAEAAAAVKAGDVERGEATLAKPSGKRFTPQEKAAARAKRKADTASAVKAGEIPRGEAGTPGK